MHRNLEEEQQQWEVTSAGLLAGKIPKNIKRYKDLDLKITYTTNENYNTTQSNLEYLDLISRLNMATNRFKCIGIKTGFGLNCIGTGTMSSEAKVVAVHFLGFWIYTIFSISLVPGNSSTLPVFSTEFRFNYTH